MGRFQWRLPIRRPALNKSGEISLSRVCVCPCDVLQRVKWAASWPSPSGWAHHGSMGGRVHGTCQRYNAVSIMSVRVYPTTRVVVVVVVLSVDIPCISSMPQAQFDICAFHPCWLVSWTAREHCVDPRRSGILSPSAALDIRWKDPVILTIGQQSLCWIRQTIVTQEEELREGVVARPDRVGW